MCPRFAAPAADAAYEAAALADCVLVVGTAGVVYPAAGLVFACRLRGATVIEVNPDGEYGLGERGAFGGIWLRGTAASIIPDLVE